ncbi:FG-GAP-like repeat-containing protein [Candidatus Sumerlaeota bacterium]
MKPTMIFLSWLVIMATLVYGDQRSSVDYTFPKEVVAAGGESVSSADYILAGTIAHPGVVGVGSSTNYTIYHGFWSYADFAPDVADTAGLAGATDGRGVGWADFDNDGDLDFCVARGTGGLQDYLYLNNGDGTFTEVAVARGVSESSQGTGVAWADSDGDGDVDLFVRNVTGESGVLWLNNGSGDFSNGTTAAGFTTSTVGAAASWGDYDGDLLPDLFMANDGAGQSHLYRNNGDGTFVRSDSTAGLSTSMEGIGTWGDYDNDGDLDLFVAQGSGKSDLLYENQGDGTFTDVSGAAGISDASSGSGPAWGDFNNDGFLDIYVPNSGSENDILYLNDGNGTFSDATVAAGIVDSADGKSAGWGDWNQDGHLDLYVTNATGQPDTYYSNNGDGTFSQQATATNSSSHGSAWSDYDGDGDVDLIVTTSDGSNFSLYRNDIDNDRFLKIRLLDSNGHYTCFGSQVRIYDAGTSDIIGMRQVDGGHGAGCQDMYDLHFGVDPNSTYDIEARFISKNGPIIIDKSVNPLLGGVKPGEVDLGRVEIRDNGRVRISAGVVYVSSQSGNNDIWLLNHDGSSDRQLTTDLGDDRDPSWSPDGDKIVFASDRDGDWDLFVSGIDGSPPTQLTNDPSSDTQPAWSSDGNTIAFVSDRDGNSEVYIVDTSGSGARNLTADPATDLAPSWSPNSGKIVFSSDRDGDEEIFKMNFDGSNVEQLTTNTAQDTLPVYSPSGLQIAFTSYRDGNANVYVMNFDGSGQYAVTTDTATDQHPTWTPAGDEIVFQSDRDGNDELYICKLDGNGVRRLTDNSSFDGMPNYPMPFRYPPRSIVFGEKNGRVTYWADPVNTELGNYTYSHTDFILPGTGQPIVFARYYNSQDPLDGPLGYGWRHSYLITANEGVDGDVTITWGDGHQDIYRLMPGGGYVHWDGNTNGELTSSTVLSFTQPDGTVYVFDSQGRVASISDRNDETITLSYTGSDLTGVTQANGRNLTLSYSSGRITSVADHTGRNVSLAYDGNDVLKGVATSLPP